MALVNDGFVRVTASFVRMNDAFMRVRRRQGTGDRRAGERRVRRNAALRIWLLGSGYNAAILAGNGASREYLKLLALRRKRSRIPGRKSSCKLPGSA
jgi:hypothetical protein